MVDAGAVICNDSEHIGPPPDGKAFLTKINPEGGYRRARFLCCDACMRSGRWEYWKSKHWPNWPTEPREFPE